MNLPAPADLKQIVLNAEEAAFVLTRRAAIYMTVMAFIDLLYEMWAKLVGIFKNRFTKN
jgi:hypothetical protein